MIEAYTLDALKQLAPVLKDTVLGLPPGQLKLKGIKLMQACDQLTRGADLVAMLFPNSPLEKCVSAYLIPNIKNYLQETQGKMSLSPMMRLLPSAATFIQSTGILDRMTGGAA